ncbi:MAG: hypothetical protein U0X73_17545 [Thermoanaerobaculia bacterium]
MTAKILGVLIAVLGLAISCIAAFSFVDRVEMAEFLAFATADSDAPVDSAEWVRHWRVSGFVMLAWGAALVVSGVALWRRRRWSLLILAGAAAALLVLELATGALGYAKYAYELPETAELFFLGLVAAGALLAYSRWRNSTAVQ